MTSDELPRGPFTADGVHFSRQVLRTLLAAGQLRRMIHGVYVAADAPDTLALRSAALQLAVPQTAVACRGTAAWLFGIDAGRLSRGQLVPLVEVAVGESSAAVRRPGVKGYVEHLDAGDVTTFGGVRVTTPLRTAADLVRWLPRYEAIGVLDSMVRSGLVSVAQLNVEAERWFGYKGVRQLRELVAFADPRAESRRESWLRLLLHDAGFPPTVPQLEVRRPGRAPYRLDLAIEELMTAFEYDGVEVHGPEQGPADEARRRYIRSQGWTVIVVRRGDLERPQRLVDAVGMFISPIRRARAGLGLRTNFGEHDGSVA